MKNNKFFQLPNIFLLAIVILISGCQNFDEPEFGNYPLDGPIITLISPNPNGTTVIQSADPITSVTIQFTVEDDIAVSNVLVMVDGVEVANMNSFPDVRMVNVDDLVYDNVDTGTHTFSITATDSDNNVVTITTDFVKEDTLPYNPLNGEVLFMPFDGNFVNLVTSTPADVVGNPGFAGESLAGSNAYAGATDSYLTYPTNGMLGNQFTASFWYKLNANPDRAGVLVVGPEDTGNSNYPDIQNLRTSGFRFFRENADGKQRFKLNVGNGSGDNWFDGGAAADVDPASSDWVHLAFSISETEAVVYINGQVVSQGSFSGIDWTGCDILSIMSGKPRFSEWGHHSDLSYMDDLRIFNVALTQNEIIAQMAYGSQSLYMPFDGTYSDIINDVDATVVGNPGFTGAGEAHVGNNAYAGATDSYLTMPTDGLNLGSQFSTTFWLNVNANPDRGGVLVIGPEDTMNSNYPDIQNLRTSGFRFFRENADGKQRFKLNVGNGSGDNWFDGGAAADVDPSTTDWVHMAFTISETECTVYINGTIVSQGTFPGIDWTGCNLVSIMSGDPRFSEWGHHSDLSYMDDLRFYNTTLTPAEIQAMQ